MLPSGMHRPWAEPTVTKFRSYFHSLLQGHPQAIHPHNLSVYASRKTSYAHPATFDTRRMVDAYPDGIPPASQLPACTHITLLYRDTMVGQSTEARATMADFSIAIPNSARIESTTTCRCFSSPSSISSGDANRDSDLETVIACM